MSEEPTNWSSWEEKLREATNRELIERLIRERGRNEARTAILALLEPTLQKPEA
jgi:hypothetical protein